MYLVCRSQLAFKMWGVDSAVDFCITAQSAYWFDASSVQVIDSDSVYAETC